jgi:hypothetical protein
MSARCLSTARTTHLREEFEHDAPRSPFSPVSPGADPAAGQTFVFHLRGDQEVPAVPSAASGGCMGQLNQGAGELVFSCVHNVSGATVMHVTRWGGVNGPVV